MSYARVHEIQLPTIEELVGLAPPCDREDDWTQDTRVQTTGSVRRIPSPSAIVRAAVRVDRAPEPPPFEIRRVRDPRQAAPTVVTLRAQPRAALWPVFLCGLIGGVFGGTAFFKSPVAKTPAVKHVVHELHAMVGTVAR